MTVALRAVASLLFVFVVLAGCRKWPTETRSTPASDEISFVGVGSIDSPPINVLIVLANLDSNGYHSGSITYRAATSTFTELSAPAALDTLSFAYARSNVTYRAWAPVSANGLVLHFTEPSSLEPVVLNREIGGYNMTGLWEGEMSSTLLQGQRPAGMTMDQTGTLFLGTVNVSFFEPWTYDFSNGSASGGSFQLSGTVATSGGPYPALFTGSYSGPDSLYGSWDVGSESEIDRGEFLFTRSFR